MICFAMASQTSSAGLSVLFAFNSGLIGPRKIIFRSPWRSAPGKVRDGDKSKTKNFRGLDKSGSVLRAGTAFDSS